MNEGDAIGRGNQSLKQELRLTNDWRAWLIELIYLKDKHEKSR